MPIVPSVMVLYSNDAVEVRYSDGSRLQLSPCGSSMLHQSFPSKEARYSTTGIQEVHKWTQFVTSAHKAKVLQALDFRNRFAHRPFLCSNLMPQQDIVSLYAKIDKVAWPKRREDLAVEVLGDGSRRAVSCDQFASLVLSPHSQDFTVCYLSPISQDAAKDSSDHASLENPSPNQSFDYQESYIAEQVPAPHLNAAQGSTHLNAAQGSAPHLNAAQSSAPYLNAAQGSAPHLNAAQSYGLERAGRDPPPEREHSGLNSNCNNSNAAAMSERGLGTEGDAQETLQPLDLASGVILSDGTFSTPGRMAQQSDLQASAVSAMHQDISSISRVSTPDGLRGMVDCDATLSVVAEATANAPSPSADFFHSSPLSVVANTQKCADQGRAALASEHGAGRQFDETTGRGAEGASPTLPSSTSNSSDPQNCSENRRNSENDRRHSVKQAGTCEVKSSQSSRAGNVSSADKTCQTVPCNRSSNSQSNNQGLMPQPPRQLEEQSSQKTYPDQTQPSTHNQFNRNSNADFPRGREEAGGYHGSRNPPESGREGQLGRGGEAVGGVPPWSASQCQYTWVTQHFSCSQCPAAWRHPLRLLQLTDPAQSLLISECNLTVSSHGGRGWAGAPDTCVYSATAAPLPLCCPFQHLHTWQPPQDEGEGEGHLDFRQGQFHVIMMEGVVYRFVTLANMKVVEIYPGDGSVFVSQGMTAHFFSHLAWNNGKLEEKTFSVKLVQANTSKSPYNVEKLIKRGQRFLAGTMQSSRMPEREEVPCWKEVPVQVVEPLSSSVLEECSVPGYGRFTAYSNGRIRIVFDDRTALDMVSDFSQRLKTCFKHSDKAQELAESVAALKVTSFDQQLSCHRCRLLLPTGKYIIVEVHKPGVYRKYIDAANEWISWVKASPVQRRQFYLDKAAYLNSCRSAEAELKKIECFNYIVEHSGSSALGHTQDTQAEARAHPHPAADRPAPEYRPLSHHHTEFSHHHTAAPGQLHCQTQLPVPAGQRPTRSLGVCPPLLHPTTTQGPLPHPGPRAASTFTSDPKGVRPPLSHPVMTQGPLPLSGHRAASALTSDPKGVELVQGFNSVREALLRTSQMIRDIDDIVNVRRGTKS